MSARMDKLQAQAQEWDMQVRLQEREAIAAWLDAKADEANQRVARAPSEVKTLYIGMAGALRSAAHSLEQGEHLKGNDGGS